MFRWGILGTGFISDVMARAIGRDDRAEIHVMVERRPQALAAFAAAWPGVRTFSMLDALLADPDVDAVYVAWPNHLHAPAVIACAQAGKAVLCEKSFSVDMASTDAALEAVRSAGVFLMEGLMFLTHPRTGALRDVVASGELGEVRLVQGTYVADIVQFVNPGSRGAIFNLGCYPASLTHLLLQMALGGLVREGVQVGRQEAPRPAPRPADTREIMQLLSGWETSVTERRTVTLE